MTTIPFTQMSSPPPYGPVEQIRPLIQRVTAKNPGPFTYAGTGTYIVGNTDVAVIDPGPIMPAHLKALEAALDGRRVSHILITHTHLDHSPAAQPLQETTGAATFGFGPHGSGRSGGLEEETVEAGADTAFVPDETVKDGDIIIGDGWTLEAVHTPGHTSNHLCFGLPAQQALFTGDHVMGWSTTIVSPPDGDMAAYMASLARLLLREDQLYLPTHGAVIENPHDLVRGLIDHRKEREAAILDHLASGPAKISSLVAQIYRDTPKGLHPAAARSVLAHLIKLEVEGRVTCDGLPSLDSTYTLVRP